MIINFTKKYAFVVLCFIAVTTGVEAANNRKKRMEKFERLKQKAQEGKSVFKAVISASSAPKKASADKEKNQQERRAGQEARGNGPLDRRVGLAPKKDDAQKKEKNAAEQPR